MLYNNYCIHEINEYLMTLTTYIYIRTKRPNSHCHENGNVFFPVQEKKDVQNEASLAAISKHEHFEYFYLFVYFYYSLDKLSRI